jgi:Domain of unknown function (DUF4145)
MAESAQIFLAAKAIQQEIASVLGPPAEGVVAPANAVIPAILFRNTRGYLVKVANQANGAYSSGWYDACAVMLRRLLETLIIEAFEHHKIASRIQNANGDFLYLRDLIDKTIAETSWNLSRNAKNAMPKLKDVGDKSAHSRRFNALRSDIDKVAPDLRLVAEELLSIAGLR